MIGIDGDRDQDPGQQDWQDGEGEPLETERLALEDDEERLPWLESGDDEDYADYEGGDNSRILGFFVMGLIALGVLVGAIWWASHRGGDAALVADGSTVPAPAGPYKEAPKDPGGKTFAGTGDSSFAVSEGQTRPGQLGGASPAPAPAPSPAATASAAPKPATAAPAPAAASGGVGVQVGAFSNKAAAEAGWSKLVAQAGGALSGVSHRVIEGKADNGTIFRLQAVAGDAGAAASLCASLKAKGIACQVK
jgi:SPOR domain